MKLSVYVLVQEVALQEQVGKVFDRISDLPKLQNPRPPIGRSPLLGDRSQKK
jgi:hypothetical protein